MNGSSTFNCPNNEQLSGKFHVDQIVNKAEESGCASRFQTIRIDRKFRRGRWKVNDHEPPENTALSTLSSINNDHDSTGCNVHPPTVVNGDSNIVASAAFQQQQQQSMALNNTPTGVSPANVLPTTGFLHGYPAGQSYLRPQFGYYHFYPPPYSHYAPAWTTTALAASNPYLQQPALVTTHQQSATGSLPITINANDQFRSSNADNNGENTFLNPPVDPLQNAQFAAYLYALHHSHSPYLPHTASSYATIPSFHPVPHQTILPPQNIISSNNTSDIPQSCALASPSHEGTEALVQQPSSIASQIKPLVTTVCNSITDDPPTLISLVDTSNVNAPSHIGSNPTAGSALNSEQTEAVITMDSINDESNQHTEMTDDLLKELKTPTKQNSTTDIDNEISAAMDLVKMHLLSAVREEVTELRHQIRILHETMNSMEHENVFLRQHVSSEIYAQYIPILSSSNDSTTNSLTSISSSQPVSI